MKSLIYVYLFPFIFFLGHVPVFAGADIEAQTYFDDERNVYVTTGKAPIDGFINRLGAAAADYPRYREWSLIDINGDSDNSRRFISIIRDIEYQPALPRKFFDVTYDVDLIWPFGSEGKHLMFEIFPAAWEQEELRKLTIRLAEENFFLDQFDLTMELEEQNQSSELKFLFEMKLASFVDIFFSLEKYKKNIEWRIVRVIKNLQGHVSSQYVISEIKNH